MQIENLDVFLESITLDRHAIRSFVNVSCSTIQ